MGVLSLIIAQDYAYEKLAFLNVMEIRCHVSINAFALFLHLDN